MAKNRKPMHMVLRNLLVDQLRRRTFDYRGRTYPLSTNAIDQIVRELTSPALNEGLTTANEKLHNAITLGVTVTEFVDGKKRSEEHTSELQSLMRISYAVLCLKKKNTKTNT